MLCLAAKAWARAGSRAATAATTTSGFFFAGLVSASGAIRAAPRMPIRTCSGTDPTLALGPECAAWASRVSTGRRFRDFLALGAPAKVSRGLAVGRAAREGRRALGPDADPDEIGGQNGQPRQPLDDAEECLGWRGVRAAQQRAEQRPL